MCCGPDSSLHSKSQIQFFSSAEFASAYNRMASIPSCTSQYQLTSCQTGEQDCAPCTCSCLTRIMALLLSTMQPWYFTGCHVESYFALPAGICKKQRSCQELYGHHLFVHTTCNMFVLSHEGIGSKISIAVQGKLGFGDGLPLTLMHMLTRY